MLFGALGRADAVSVSRFACEVCGASFVPADGRSSTRHCGADRCHGVSRRRRNAERMAAKRSNGAAGAGGRRPRSHLVAVEDVPLFETAARGDDVDAVVVSLLEGATADEVAARLEDAVDLAAISASMVLLIVETAQARAQWYSEQAFPAGVLAWANVAHAYAAFQDDASAALRKQAVDAAIRTDAEWRASNAADDLPDKLLASFALAAPDDDGDGDGDGDGDAFAESLAEAEADE